MDAREKGNLLYATVVGGALLFILFVSGVFDSYHPLTGEVVAVEGGRDSKEALIRLASGDVVRAKVPVKRVVVAGQVANLYESGSALDRGPRYTVWSSKDKE